MVVAVRARGDVDQDALAQLDGFEIGAVGAQRLLGIGAAVGIFEERPRHLAAGGLPQVLDAGHGFHGLRFPALSAPLIAQSQLYPAGVAARNRRACQWLSRDDEPRPRLSSGCRHRERRRWTNTGIEPRRPADDDFEDEADTKHRREQDASRKKKLDEALDWARGYLSRFRPGLGHPAAAEPV